eukprot:CAMPEP_0114641782 /NCGR_PEP_ID=MMETSP0191-20121206/2459_1 /TAXON_ID=126664 /ORGANISM="Sorites sp." /LENGTH=167 /DNA_ID=CAMNT_0001853883 /DNA_START=66 /DNA_END=569 /DNA_ORIENTATION=+
MEEVQSATAQVIHLVLQPNPEPTMAQIWNQIERLIVQHINPGFLQDLVEQIEIMQDGNQLTTDEVQDIATCAVMQEVEEILQGVISRHLPEVAAILINFGENWADELKEAVRGQPSSHTITNFNGKQLHEDAPGELADDVTKTDFPLCVRPVQAGSGKSHGQSGRGE